MSTRRTPKATKAEESYIRDMKRRSAFEGVDSGTAEILAEDQYPEPLRRLIRRERSTVRVRLSVTARRRLEALSRKRGVKVEELARQWVEQRLSRSVS